VLSLREDLPFDSELVSGLSWRPEVLMARARWWLLLALPLSLPLLGFTPFSEVSNVCPKCPPAKTDLVVLVSGTKIACRVLAQNDDYYVLSRHGEQRAVMKAEVSKVKWRSADGASSLGTGDQILQKNGVVLHGAVVEEGGGRFYVIQVGTIKHVVWVSQIQSLHRAGKAVTLGTATPLPKD